MSGCFSIIREVVTLYSEKPNPFWQKHLFWSCVWITFIISSITAWVLKQRELLTEREKNAHADIGVEIQEVYNEDTVREGGISPNHIDGYFTLRVHLVNKGRPIAIRRFELQVNYDKGVRLTSTTPLNHLAFEYKRTVTPKESYYFSKEEAEQGPLIELSRNLIDSGDNREGWLRFVLTEVSNEQLEEMKGITLLVVDAESNIHKATADKVQWRQTGKLINTYLQEQQRYIEMAEKDGEKGQRTYYHDELRTLLRDFSIFSFNKQEDIYLRELRDEYHRRAEELLKKMENDLGESFITRFKEKDFVALEEIKEELLAKGIFI